MSYPKTKAERYENFGGLNTKVSRYQTDQRQVIRLINYDFSNPGALTKRPGFQYFGGASYGGFITQLYQYQKLSGASYSIVSGQSGLFFVGVTAGRISPFVPPGSTQQIFPASFLVGSVGQTYIPTFQTMNDALYIASHPAWYVWDSVGATAYEPLPARRQMYGITYATYATAPFFETNMSYRWFASLLKGESRAVYSSSQFSGVFQYVAPGVAVGNGPYWYGLANLGATYVDILGFTNYITGAQYNGCSYVLLYRQILQGYTANNANLDVVPLTTTIWKIPVQDIGTSLAGYYFRDFGTYAVSASYCLTPAQAGVYRQHTYEPFNQGWVLPLNPTTETSPPSLIEIFNNMMIYGGFQSAPSKIFWSNLSSPWDGSVGGGPEYVDAENFADIRTNDGDILSNITSYGTECVIGKRNSIHSLTGTDPDSISIQLKSTQYGILSKRGACTWENYFWFLDRKGIVEYNGANFQVVSTPVEDIFKRMNFAWAQEIAILSHQKMRNEIWCCIPIDGATYNNIVVVYDYVSKAWTTFEGVNASALISTALTMPIPQPVIGASGGRMAQMGITHYADFGGVYTTAVRFPFVTNYGWSVQQVFRRLFVDTDPVIGQNRTFLINLFGDMLNNASYTLLTTFGATFQYRTDFGMYCKSMSVEIFEATTYALKLNGYTVESRFQRNV